MSSPSLLKYKENRNTTIYILKMNNKPELISINVFGGGKGGLPGSAHLPKPVEQNTKDEPAKISVSIFG